MTDSREGMNYHDLGGGGGHFGLQAESMVSKVLWASL